MALEHDKQLMYEKRIQDIMDDGFFLPSGRSLSGETRHLIISFGGTGADALFGVKKLFETVLPAQQLKERVRFLAIDTDAATQKSTAEVKKDDGTTITVELDALKPAQFYQLNGGAARNIVTHPELDTNVAKWINPRLVENIKSSASYLDGTGASGVRQVGRLAMYPANTVNTLSQRITTLAKELTDETKAQLRVFILTGIAGGTGSGTVIDLSYLVRDSIPEHLTERTRYCGFVMLPPTGKGSSKIEVDHGNSNGYAALKEINHFMTLKQRNDTYSFTYGSGYTVTSQEPIFDTCYLLDGFSDEMGFENPRKQAVKVLSNGLLDMITSSMTVGEDTVQTVASFMSDAATFAKQMLSLKPSSVAMRDADYVYCALGHSDFSLPANEIKAYVGKQFFDKIYSQFKKFADVGDKDAKEFVDRVVKRGATSPKETKKSMDKEIEDLFTDRSYGPFYTINLLYEVVEEAANRGAKAWTQKTRDSMGWIESYAANCNKETYAAYTCAMDGLKVLMEKQFGAVVKVEKGEHHYSFLPLSLGESEDAKYIIDYLNGLINKNTLIKLCDDLLQEMIDNRDNWVALISTDVAAKNNAPAAMRKFWNEKLDAMVNSTMEDFLIKFYSGNPAAHYSPESDAATRPYLEKAAEAIYEQMLGAGAKAQPLVQLTGRGLSAGDFNGHTFLLVPEVAPHLYEALEEYAKTHGDANDSVKVCKSLAVDRISCYKQYSGLPAYKLVWTQTAEKAYEAVVNTDAGVGLHMSETAAGNLWKNFPNLLPKSTWSSLKGAYSNDREQVLADKAESLFDRAKDMKLAASDEQEGMNQIYHVKLLGTEFRPNEDLYKALERARPGSDFEKEQLSAIEAAARKCADVLFTKVPNWEGADNLVADLKNAGVAFAQCKLRFPETVISQAAGDDPTGWDEAIAARMLRKLPGTMSELDATLLVMGYLKEKVERVVKSRTLIKRFAQYLAMELFKFNDETQTWEYLDENEVPHELAYLDSDVEAAGEFYFMFDAFRNNTEAVVKALSEQFAELLPVSRATRVTRQAAFREGGNLLKAEVATWLKTKPMKPFEKIATNKGYNVNAIQNFYNALYQEAIEIAAVGYVPVELECEQEAEDDFVPENNGGGDFYF